MNVYPNYYDNYIDATNEFIGGGGGGSSTSSNIIISGGGNLSDYLYLNNASNLILNNPYTYSEIRFANLYTAANVSRNHNVKIDYFGKLQVYHPYSLANPTVLEGWKDVESEIAGLIFGLEANTLEVIVVQGQIAAINAELRFLESKVTGLEPFVTAINANMEAMHYGFFSQSLYEEMVQNNFSYLLNEIPTLVSGFRDVAFNTRVSQFLGGVIIPAAAGAVIGFFATHLDNHNLHIAYSNALNSNTNLTPSERSQLLAPSSNIIRNNYISFNSNFCNMTLEQGFINSNIKNNQLIPSLKSNKVLLGNITTPNASYQMEGTGDINFNEYYRNSVSLTSLLSQKQDNMSATQPIFITTANIGLNYDSSLTKVGNNLSVVKTASAPLQWSGNNLILNFDNTLINNAGSLGVSIGAESKWAFSGGNIYNKSLTNVGIGTNSGLTYKLNVIGDTYISSNTHIGGISKLSYISAYSGQSYFGLATGTDEYYIEFNAGGGTLILNEPCACDILIVGAGGNGGSGTWSGGGGAGEVIYYPNFPLRAGQLNIQVGASGTNTTNRISRIYPSSGNEIMRAKGGGNGASITNQSLFALFQNKKPWGMYFAEDWSGTTLLDSSGNGRHATTSGTITKTTASGNGATGPITYISGGTSSTITWPSGSIPSTFTILSLTRYTNAISNQQRILQASTLNFAHGHINTTGLNDINSTRGVCFYGDTYKTNSAATSSATKLNWLCTIGKNSGSTPGNILLDGVASGTASGGTGNNILTLNTGLASSQLSDFAFSCVIIWNTALTDAEMVLLNNMIDQYKIDGVYIPNVINAFTSATSGGSGGGGIIGVSSPGAAAGLKFDDYKSFVQAGLNGSSTTGGNGGSGSSLYNTRFTTNITGSSLSVALGGSGASSSSTPVTKSNYGDGGDGNGGNGFGGIVIIRFKLDSTYLQVKAIKNNGNSGLILNANETISGTTTPYQLRIFPWSDTYTSTSIPTRGWSFRTNDGITTNDLINLFSYFGGRVGIKTKNPTATLDVNGDIACKTFSVVGNEQYGIVCQITNQHETGEASFGMYAGQGTSYGGLAFYYLPPDNLGYISCSKSFKIKTGNDAANSYIYIDNTTGNIGIGLTNPASKLGVNGMITTNDIQVNNGLNATIISAGQLYSTGIDTNLINNLNGTITNVNNLFTSNIYINNAIDMQNKNILNCGYVYGGANWANEWKAYTNYYHKDDQGRDRIYFKNDTTGSPPNHFTLFKSGGTTHTFADKDDVQYCLLDRFGITTYFEVISGGAYDNLGVADGVSSGTYVFRKMYLRLSTFTEVHRCFCSDDLYLNYDDFINEYIGRVVISKGKIKTALKEAGKDWQILEGKDGITIDDSHPEIELSRKKMDKRVVGVITKRENNKDMENRLVINSLGETAIWVVNTNGNIENGDLLQTSDLLGYAELQILNNGERDDIIRNYTIGKVMIDCSFDLNDPNYKCEDLGNDLRRAFLPIFIYSG